MSAIADDVGDVVGSLESGVEKVLIVIEQQSLETIVDRPQHVGPVVVVRVHPRPTAAAAAAEARTAGFGSLLSLGRDQPVHVSSFSSVFHGLVQAGWWSLAPASAAPLQAITSGSKQRVLT